MGTRVEPTTESDSVTAALRFARRMHLGQHRKQTGEQFVEHPIAVARLLSEQGFDGPIMSAAYLHDVVEKTPVKIGEIRQRFGPRVADLVESLSEDPAVDGYCDRKRALRDQILGSDRDAVLIYAADRVANLRDWVAAPRDERDQIAERLDTTLGERLDLWDEDLRDLTELDEDLPFLPEIEIELRALRNDLP
ncbi:MAG: bifunctional (p)ppGpp synthetase/guanosine-3',5'-bis(diphosphate) 3'-pyrophosphohydrolase [Solirubrobacterales bacterium]|nr:bifunctional (p)ppGpp synthetase/guanosine-3',5'-bis(diphosphate) 3'-pyrophosphohydrolase [Solirubrobacterales bacterium]